MTLSSLDISGNEGINGSGFISVSGPCNLALHNSQFSTNVGGALELNGGASATVTECTFDRNVRNGSGGAIRVNKANLRAVNCSFIGNSAEEGDGGAIYAEVGISLSVVFSLMCCILSGTGRTILTGLFQAGAVNPSPYSVLVHKFDFQSLF